MMSQSARRAPKEDDLLVAMRRVEELMGKTLNEAQRYKLKRAIHSASIFYNRTDTPPAEMQERLKIMGSSAEKLMQSISVILHERGLVTMLDRMEEDKVDWRFTDFQRTYDALRILEEELPKMALWIRPRAKRAAFKKGRPENEGNLTVLVFQVIQLWCDLYPDRWNGRKKRPVGTRGNKAAFVECVSQFLRYAHHHKRSYAAPEQLATTVLKELKEIQGFTTKKCRKRKV